MNRSSKFAAVIGMTLVLAPWAVAQAPAGQPAASPASATVIPPDQQPTKEQLAKLFELIRVREQVQSVLKMMPAMVQQQMRAQAKERTATPLAPDQQAAIARITDKYMEKALSIVTIDEMLDDMTVIYQRHVSRSDVEAMTAFYSSPAGQHFLDAQPVIMREYMPLVMTRVQERSKILADEQTKEMEELTGSHVGGNVMLPHLLAPPPPPPPPPPAK